ncbi:MAG: hypothetical protein VX980_04320, partial [Actinomycetota bacterium]|nr:hypothetical protein [Actinomycetota bacterium]
QNGNYEEVRGCVGVSVGRLWVRWKFRHHDTSNDGCPCRNPGTDHDGADHDGADCHFAGDHDGADRHVTGDHDRCTYYIRAKDHLRTLMDIGVDLGHVPRDRT